MHETPSTPPEPRRRRRLRTFGVGLIVLSVAVLLALQVGPVRLAVVNAALAVFNPWPGTLLQAAGAGGRLPWSLELRDVTLTRTDYSTALRIDSLRLSWSLLPVLRRTVHLHEVTVEGLDVDPARGRGGELDLLAPFLSDESSSWSTRIDRVRLDRGSIRVHDGDSVTWEAGDLVLRAAAVRTGSAFSGRLDSLAGTLAAPGPLPPGRFLARAEVESDGARLDTLLLATSRSNARMSGRVVFGKGTVPDSVTAHIVAYPLSLADFAGLWPALRADGVVEGRLDAEISGSGWFASGDLSLRAPGEPPGRVRLETSRDTVSTRIEGRIVVEDVGTALLVAGRPASERISGTAFAQLEGAFPGGLTGSSSIDVTRARLGNVDLVGRLDQRWTAGRVALDGRGRIADGGATWSVDGSARWIDGDSTWSVRMSVADLGVSDLAPTLDLAASGSFSVEVSGDGYTTSASVDGLLRLDDAVVASCRIGPGTATASLRRQVVSLSVEATACGGAITGSGETDIDGDWTLIDLALSDVDAALALSDTSGSRISGRISGRGTGMDRYRIGAALDSLRWGPVRIDRLEAEASANAGVVSLDSAVRADWGIVRARGALTPDALQIEALELDGVDVGNAAGIAAVHTRLRAAGRAVVSRRRGEGGTMDLEILPSLVNGVVASGHVRLRAPRADTLAVDTTLEWLGGGLTAGARARRDSAGVWHASTDGVRFRGLDVGAWAGVPDWTTSFTGSVEGSGRIDADVPSGSVRLRLDEPGTIRGIALRRADLDLAARGGSVESRLDAEFSEGGRLRARGAASDVPDGSWTLDIEADAVDFARLSGLDSLGSSIHLQVRAEGTGREGRLRVERAHGSWRDAVLSSAVATADVTAGTLRIDSLGVVGSFGHVTAKGSLPLDRRGGEGNLRVSGLFADIGPWAAAAGFPGIGTRGGRIDGSVTGRPERLSANATLSLDGIALGALHVTTGRAIASAEWGSELEAPAASVRFDARVLSLPGTAAEGLVVDVRLAGDSLDVTGDVRFADTRSARLELRSDRRLSTASLRTLDLLLDGAAWSLATPVSATRTDDVVEWSPLVLTSGGSRLVTGGRIGRESSDFFLSASGMKLDAVADLAGFRGLGLGLDATLVASGPARDLSVGGSIEARLASAGLPAADLSLQTRLEHGVVAVSGLLRHTSGREARIEGTVELPGGEREGGDVAFDVSADAFPIDWTLPFFDRELVDAIGGAVTGTLAVRGTFQDPVLDGAARLAGGRMGLPTLGRPGASLVFDAIEADLGFSGNTILVREASMRSGPGRMTATGTVELTELDLGAVALDLRSEDFLAIDDEEFRAFVASDLRLTGTTRRPVLTGQARVTRGDFRLTDRTASDAFEPVALSDEDLLTLERRFGLRVSAADTSTFVFYEALTIEDLRLDFDRDAWMRSARNPKMDVQFRGSLNVRKRPHSDPTVFGDISVLPENSRIEQFGRTFEMERGDLSFTGPAFEPDIDLVGSYRVPSRGTGGDEVTIRLVARGRPDDLRVTFESDPAMELADVVSYIATGRPASGSLHFDAAAGNSYLGTAAGLAVGPLTSFVEDIALAGLGLDVVEIENDGLRGLTLTVGKYVSPEFYVSVSQPIALGASPEAGSVATERRTQVMMEYEIVRQLLVSLLNRGAVLRINLRWEYAF